MSKVHIEFFSRKKRVRERERKKECIEREKRVKEKRVREKKEEKKKIKLIPHFLNFGSSFTTSRRID